MEKKKTLNFTLWMPFCLFLRWNFEKSYLKSASLSFYQDFRICQLSIFENVKFPLKTKILKSETKHALFGYL